MSVLLAEVDVAAVKNGDPCQLAEAEAVAPLALRPQEGFFFLGVLCSSVPGKL